MDVTISAPSTDLLHHPGLKLVELLLELDPLLLPIGNVIGQVLCPPC
jgi:hypothetical protein